MQERRERLRNDLPTEDQFLYNAQTAAITYDDFINRELVLFSDEDNNRSIPSLVDGLKPGQRKASDFSTVSSSQLIKHRYRCCSRASNATTSAR